VILLRTAPRSGQLRVLLQTTTKAKASADRIGATKLLDKMELAQELIPAILELATSHRN